MISKEHFTSLFSPARKKAFTPKNIIAGFVASGLFSFDLDRVLRSMPKPVVDLNNTRVDEVNVKTCAAKTKVPQTLTMLVSAESLISLHNLIMKQDTRALNEIRRQDLQRHL